jgi:hypothetical protein
MAPFGLTDEADREEVTGTGLVEFSVLVFVDQHDVVRLVARRGVEIRVQASRRALGGPLSDDARQLAEGDLGFVVLDLPLAQELCHRLGLDRPHRGRGPAGDISGPKR